MDVLNPLLDQKFHGYLQSNIKQSLHFYFKQFIELQERVSRIKENCQRENIDYNMVITSAFKGETKAAEAFLSGGTILMSGINTVVEEQSVSQYSSKFEAYCSPNKFINTKK